MLPGSGLSQATAQLQGGKGADEVAKAKGALLGAKDGSMTTEEVGQQFEELFSTMLVREMRKSAKSSASEGGLFGKGAGADIYEGWFDEKVGAAIAAQGSLGLVGMVKASIGRLESTEEQS